VTTGNQDLTGLDCPTESGTYEFSDSTTGEVGPPVVPADPTIPDPLHPDRFGNLQGNVSTGANNTPGGAMAYSSNGGGWGNPAGGLIVSTDHLGMVEESLVYTLSMMAQGPEGSAIPIVLDLLAGGVVLTPDSSADPVLSGEWQEISRTYNAASFAGVEGEPLTIVLGVAVDGTIHFLARFREEIKLGDGPAKAIYRSYISTGRAIVMTSVLIVAGLSVLLLSEFLPSRRFAELTGVTMLGALVGDLLLLPACLMLFWKRRAA